MDWMRLNGASLLMAVLLTVGCDSSPDTPDSGQMMDSGEDPDSGVDPCADVEQCAAAGTSCSGDTLVTCAANADGCLVETEMDCAATAGGSCDDSGAAAMCVVDPCEAIPAAERCDTEGRACDGDSLEVCAPNADGCLVLDVTDCAASPGGVCDDGGAMPMCALPPDPCAGVADACAAEGTSCDGDTLVTCAPNAFGCLVETRDDCSSRASGTCDGAAAPAACTFTGDPCDGVDQCATLGATCDGPELVECEMDAFGCMVETRTTCTDTMFGFCDAAGSPAPTCSTAAVDPCMGVMECSPVGRACMGDDLVVCQPNEFGCAVETTTDCAATAVFCDDAGAMPVCRSEFSYFEDFEAGPGGWTAGGTNSSWAHGMADGPGGTPTMLIATNPAGSYNNSEDESYMESPPLDMSRVTGDPMLTFDHRFETEGCCDEGWVEISLDGGATFTKLGEAGGGVNWYNDTSNDWWDGTSSGWRRAAYPLVGAAGNADVRIRFVFDSDGSVTRDGFYVDNVRIEPVTDAAVASVSLGLGECPTSTDALNIEVANVGSTTINSFDVVFSVDGGATTTETVTLTIAPGARETYQTTATFDLTAPGTYVIEASVVLVGDEDATNDMSTGVVSGLLPLGAGYTEDFEADNGGWTAGGANFSWAHGAPAGTVIAAAGGGTNAWVTNLSGNYPSNESSWVRSGCFDFSAVATDPTLSFQHIFETESCCDEGWVEVWTASTGTWTKLGDGSMGTNWYNDTTNEWWDGVSGAAWRMASHPLTGTAGEAAVRIRHRFDSDGSLTEEGFGIDDVSITP